MKRISKHLWNTSTKTSDINLTETRSTSQIQLLDLEIYKNDNQLKTKTNFKTIDGNGYISTRSCHHPMWTKAIPKGQFTRIQRNCDDDEDFFTQTDILIKRFEEKGYERQALLNTREQISKLDRETILKDKPKKQHKKDTAFITGYNLQYKAVEKSFKKYWPILLRDHTLKGILPEKTIFIYRKATGLRHMIAKNVANPPKQRAFLQRDEFYRCGKCQGCTLKKSK